MYLPPKFALSPDDVAAALAAAGFAQLVTYGPDGLLVTPLPLLYDPDRHADRCCFDFPPSDVVLALNCSLRQAGGPARISRWVIEGLPSCEVYWLDVTGSRSRSAKTRLATKIALSAFGKPQ